AARRARRAEALGGVLWGMVVRGPFCLLVGGVLLALAPTLGQPDLSAFAIVGKSGTEGVDPRLQLGQQEVAHVAIVVLLAGLGLLIGWLLPRIPRLGITPALARRAGFSLIGLGWLIFSFQLGSTFLALFQPAV